MPKPLPRDFTLSYDLVAAEKFTWGAKGLTLRLAFEKSARHPESYRAGEAASRVRWQGRRSSIETKFPAGYMSAPSGCVATGFSNNKKHNRIAVSVKKTGETLQVFIDNNKIADYPKADPPDLLFTAVSFSAGGNYGENDKFYVSNIKISKE